MQNILFLAHRIPFPPNRGDKIRAHHLLRKVAELANVHVGCFAENDEDRAGEAWLAEIASSHRLVDRKKPLVLAGIEAVLSRKPVSLTAFHSNALDEWVRKAIDEHAIDTIFVFSGQMGQYVPEDFHGRVVIDLCDVDSAKFEGYAANGERVWLNSREGSLLASEEERLGGRADATVLISQNEARLFQSRLRHPTNVDVHVIGNGIDSEFFGGRDDLHRSNMEASDGPRFVFTGQMNYRPNEQAALFVIQQVLPRIRKELPNAEFHVVGRNPTARLLECDGKDGVTITGEVPDVRPYLADAHCVLAPLQIARGVQNKVLEAMAMRCAVLLTPEAATGIDAEDGRDWRIVSHDAAGMANAAVELAQAANARIDMGESAREFILRKHAWGSMLKPLEQLLSGQEDDVRNAA